MLSRRVPLPEIGREQGNGERMSLGECALHPPGGHDLAARDSVQVGQYQPHIPDVLGLDPLEYLRAQDRRVAGGHAARLVGLHVPSHWIRGPVGVPAVAGP